MATNPWSLMGPNTYEKNPGWFRSPSVGGGLQWNSQYGWQRKGDIEKGLASGQDISKWGLTPHMQQSWQQAFPEARSDEQLKQMGLAGKGNQLYKAFQTPQGYYNYSSWSPQWKPTTQQTTQWGPGTASSGNGNISGLLQAIMKMFQGGSSGGIA